MDTANENVRAILDLLEEGNKSHMADKCGLPQPTISRIARGLNAPSLEVLGAIAKAYHFQPWQLLVPGFDPKHPPVLFAMTPQEEALYKKLQSLRDELKHLP